MPVFADDDVIMHRDTKRPGGFHDRLRHVDVGPRRGRIAGRVIVDQPVQPVISLCFNMLTQG
jgi:hypothetical protein